jgi:hypothetical protein
MRTVLFCAPASALRLWISVGPLLDVADEELDPLQGLVSSLPHFFDLLLGQGIFLDWAQRNEGDRQQPSKRP